MQRRSAILAVLAALALTATPAAAQGPLGEQFRVSQTGADGDLARDAFGPGIATNLQNGEFLTAFSADGLANDNDFEIFGQRLSPLGAELLGDFRISTSGPEGASDRIATSQDVAYNSQANEYLVVWQQDLLAGASFSEEIFGQRLAADGSEIGGDFRISTTGPDDTDVNRNARSPAVTYNATTNEYVVVWEARGNVGSGTKEEIQGQRLSAAGDLLGDDFRVSHVRTDAEFARSGRLPDIVHNPASNEFLVVFVADAGPVDNDTDIWGQRLGATGAEIGGDFPISVTDGDTREAGIFGVTLAYNARQNEFLVLFNADRLETDNDLEIWAHRLAADGTNLAGPLQITSIAPGDTARTAGIPAVAYSEIGNEYLLVYSADPVLDQDAEIFGQRIAGDGAKLGDHQRISVFGPEGEAAQANGRVPQVAYSPFTNEYMVVYEGDTATGPEDELEAFARRFASGDTTDPILTTSAGKTATARKRAASVTATCNESCVLTFKATVTGLAKSFKLKTVKKTLPFGGSYKATLRIPKSKLAAILARIKAKKKVLVKATVKAVDAAGNDATATVPSIRLK